MATQFSVVYGKVQSKLNDTTSVTLTKIKLAINQIHWDMGANIYGVTITADLVNASDPVAIADNWVYVLVEGAYALVLQDNDDTRYAAQMTLYQQLYIQMKREYLTVTGTYNTLQYLYTTLAKRLGLNSPADIARIKAAINETRWRMASQVSGLTITADLTVDGDASGIPNAWAHLLVQGSYATILDSLGDPRYTEEYGRYVIGLELMKKEYFTVSGTYNTFGYIYKTVAKMLGLNTPADIERIKTAVNRTRWILNSKIYGLTIAADLTNDADATGITDTWVYVLVQGTYAEVLNMLGDARYQVEGANFAVMLAYMQDEYITVTGAEGTFGSIYKQVAKLAGWVTPADVTRVKEAVNLVTKDITSKKDWTFLADKDNAITGSGANSYSLAAYTDLDRIIMVRCGTTADTATPIRRKDRFWIKDALGSATQTEPPQRYCDDDGTILLDCAMSATYKLYIDYKRKVTDMSADADACVIPTPWIPIVIQGAYAQTLKYDVKDKYTLAIYQQEYAIYAASLKAMIKNYSITGEDVEECIQSGGSTLDV